MATTIDRAQALQQLLQEEIGLRDHAERIAVMRRELPTGPLVKDYVFREGPADLSRNDPKEFRETKLSELFSTDKPELLVYHLMYGADWKAACPMCTMWCDGFNSIAKYVGERAGFVIVAKAEVGKLREWGKARGWNNLRLLSSHDSTFNRDFEAEEPNGDQNPGISVFARDAAGIHHHYSKWAPLDADHNRGIDFLSPVWNLFDLLPSGRDDWNATGSWGFIKEG